MASNERKIYEQVGDAMFFLPEYAYNNETMSTYQFVTECVADWLSTFNTDSATECFTAVQELKKRLEGENDS